MMDELSYHLGKISDYDFRAESVFLPFAMKPTLLFLTSPSEDKWKYRERTWNREWGIKKYDRGLHQPTPGNVTHLPIWETEQGDVGNWREAALAVDELE